MISSNSTTPSASFIPPSEDIQRLFKFDQSQNEEGESRKEDVSKQNIIADEYSFSEEEFAKMPSTLMKAVRRTDALLIQTDAARRSAIETNNEVKGIHSLLVRHARKFLKDNEKTETSAETNSEKNKTRGFRRQCKISNEMCEFMGLPAGTNSSRVDVNKAINDYIKKNGLIDRENNAQHILPDAKLWSILSEDAKGNKITYFSIQKYIKHHYKGT
jgi:chromatin remodeling complex protein RSC6